eukprot:MONOS_3193.1-p1 / transcript=MONOS_3193.1 / gene=MONOS_3193 / organism=Monocercomonoides_exilis_PA203 / gene_product=unspecified product / transcript_product=unspecified product / location=Mono_scaffold00073:41708-46091(+) / protein_length=820 / sequence_SO=supercontig / SO=protein_coding / is_pseudo=false
MHLFGHVLTIQHQSAIDALEATLAQHREITCVKYGLDVSGTPLPMNPPVMQSLCLGFVSSPQTTQLEICDIPISLQEIEFMAPLFQKISRLKNLILANCNIDDDTFVALGILILQSKYSRLRYLDLRSNHIGVYTVNAPKIQYDSTPGSKLLSRLLLDKTVKLSCLDVSNNPLGNWGVLALAQVLPRAFIRELRLSSIGMTPNGFFCLNRVIKYTPGLTRLDISHNFLGLTALHSLFNTVPHTNIISLNIRDTGLDDLSLISLGEMLKNNTKMAELDISENKISKESSKLFVECIKSNGILQTLICQDLPVPALSVFSSAAYDSQTGQKDSPTRNIICLKHEPVTMLVPFKYLSMGGYVLSGVIFLLAILAMEIADTVMDVLTILEYFQTGDLVWGILNAAFVLLSFTTTAVFYGVHSRTKEKKRYWIAFLYQIGLGQIPDTFILLSNEKGNWDRMRDPITNRELTHLSTLDNLSLCRAIVESIPQVVLQGYILLVQQKDTTIIPVLSFLGSVLSVCWVFGNYLSTIDPETVKQAEEKLDESIFWQLRTFVYILISLAVNLFRISLISSTDVLSLLFYLLISFSYWFSFFSLIMNTSGFRHLEAFLHALAMTPFGMGFYSDIAFCSGKGRTLYYRWTRSVPRFVFFCVDVVAWAFRSLSLFVHLLIKQHSLHLAILLAMLLVIFIDMTLIPLRLVIETNGVSSKLRMKPKVKAKRKKKTEKERERLLMAGDLAAQPLIGSEFSVQQQREIEMMIASEKGAKNGKKLVRSDEGDYSSSDDFSSSSFGDSSFDSSDDSFGDSESDSSSEALGNVRNKRIGRS